MARRSAGLLLFRRALEGLEVLLVHPGGPFWSTRDAGAWTLPKGEYEPPEDALAAARREFHEETGSEAPAGAPIPLGEIKQRGGKRVTAFAIEGDLDPATLAGNSVEIEWPPRSGKRRLVPEVDRAGWFSLAAARAKILPAQQNFLDRLLSALDAA